MREPKKAQITLHIPLEEEVQLRKEYMSRPAGHRGRFSDFVYQFIETGHGLSSNQIVNDGRKSLPVEKAQAGEPLESNLAKVKTTLHLTPEVDLYLRKLHAATEYPRGTLSDCLVKLVFIHMNDHALNLCLQTIRCNKDQVSEKEMTVKTTIYFPPSMECDMRKYLAKLPPPRPGLSELVNAVISMDMLDREISQHSDIESRAREVKEDTVSLPENIELPQKTQSGKIDPMYEEAVKIVLGEKMASVSFIQRKLSIGYNRAARLLDLMHSEGIVGPSNGSKPRLIIESSDFPSPESRKSVPLESKQSREGGFLVLGEGDSLRLVGGSIGSEVAVILGKRGRGKTHLGSLIAEQIVLNNRDSHRFQRSPTPFVIIDPVGSWHGLQVGSDAVSPGIPILIMGGKHGNIGLPVHPGKAGSLAAIAVNRMKYPEGVILDLHRYDLDAKCDFVGSFVGMLQDEQIRCPEDDKESIHVFIDEIHQFAPQSGGSPKQKRSGRVLAEVISASRNAEIAIGFTLITQRPARASKDILSQHDHLFVFELNGPDLEVSRRWLGRSVDMTKLSQYHYYYTGPASRLTEQVKSPARTTCSLSSSRRSDWSQKRWRKTANAHRAKVPPQIIVNFQDMMGMAASGNKKSQRMSKLLRLAAGTNKPHEAANAQACADRMEKEGSTADEFSGMKGFGEP